MARPTAETVGCVLEWPVSEGISPTPEQMAAARSFWTERVTRTLLRDVQDRLAANDPRWKRIDDLLAKKDMIYRLTGSRTDKH